MGERVNVSVSFCLWCVFVCLFVCVCVCYVEMVVTVTRYRQGRLVHFTGVGEGVNTILAVVVQVKSSLRVVNTTDSRK